MLGLDPSHCQVNPLPEKNLTYLCGYLITWLTALSEQNSHVLLSWGWLRAPLTDLECTSAGCGGVAAAGGALGE